MAVDDDQIYFRLNSKRPPTKNLSLPNRVCIVTGGSGGIGKGIVVELAKNGATVVLNYHSSEKAALDLQTEMRETYGSVVDVVKADVSKEQDVVALVEAAKVKFGKIDVLINNAGIHKDSPVWKMDKKIWDEVIDINLTGVFLCTKHVLPEMFKNGFGRIINISSIVAEKGVFGASNYAASKAGLIGFTKAVAREQAVKGITVNSVALGYFNTGMGLSLSPQTQEDIRLQIPMRHFGSVEEVSGLILYLCSEKASYITGQTIHVNGGLL